MSGRKDSIARCRFVVASSLSFLWFLRITRQCGPGLQIWKTLQLIENQPPGQDFASAMVYSGQPSGWTKAWDEIRRQMAETDEDFDRFIVSFYTDSHDGEAASGFHAKIDEATDLKSRFKSYWRPYPPDYVPVNHNTHVRGAPEFLSSMHLEGDA